MNPHAHSRFSDQHYLTLQARLLVTGKHADIAAAVGCYPSKISQYGNGTYHVPAFRAFAISAAQGNWRFLSMLAERAGAILLPHQAEIGHYSLLRLVALVVKNFGEFLMLMEKVQDDTALTDDEMRMLEQDGETLKKAIDALVAKAREQRAKNATAPKEPMPYPRRATDKES